MTRDEWRIDLWKAHVGWLAQVDGRGLRGYREKPRFRRLSRSAALEAAQRWCDRKDTREHNCNNRERIYYEPDDR
jgi:hypothetical protein